MLAAIDSVPTLSIQKYVVLYLCGGVTTDIVIRFAARSQRFIEAYATGKMGAEAVAWATKKFKNYRVTPTHISTDRILA